MMNSTREIVVDNFAGGGGAEKVDENQVSFLNDVEGDDVIEMLEKVGVPHD